MLLAVVLRMGQFATLPPGLHASEMDALSIVDEIRMGRISIIYALPDAQPQEGLYHTALWLTTLLIGDGNIGLRLLSIWGGIITLALTYTLGVRLFGRLAGLAALALMTVTMSAILLARAILPETFIPLLVTATLLALARAFPVYRRLRDEHATTTAFAAMGVLLGMAFIAYMLFTASHVLHRRSYIGFALLMLIIITVPYLIFTINRPDLNAGNRLLGEYDGMLRTLSNGLGGIAFRGDASPAHNLPERPLLDLVSAVIALVGFVTCVRYWRAPRFALPLLATLILAPPVLLASNTPNFFAFGAWLPVLALLFGAGVTTLVESAPRPTQRFMLLGLVVLLGFNVIWTGRDLFQIWANNEAVNTAYNHVAGKAAHYLDTAGFETPTVLCDTRIGAGPDVELMSGGEMVLMLMNRQDVPLRRVNCLNGLIFIEGGAAEQLILPEPNLRARIHPYLQTWLAQGYQPENTNLPDDSVLMLEVTDVLADRAGLFTTQAPALLPPEAPSQPGSTVFPPLRFGENVTWLGYENYDTRQYKPGDVVTLITYWRAEGIVPRNLNFFFHLLSDPVTIVRQRDTIAVDPRRLRDRDVFIQITQLDLTGITLPGEYTLSIGAYRAAGRLDVFVDQIPSGDRLLLYPITVQEP
jgi:hypothetical protein